MKRVLWICNIMLPAIAQELHLPYSNREGWLSGIFQQLTKEAVTEVEEIKGRKQKGEEAANEKIHLGICFPVTDWSKAPVLEQVGGFFVKGVPCYAFLEDLGHPENYDSSMEERFGEIFADFQPDIIHIFGTEFPHALAAVRCFGRPERTLVGIQGLCGEIARVYMAGLPEKVQKQVTFRDFIRRDSIRQQQEKFIRRGEHEARIIKGCGNIPGRTRFDREGTAKLNPDAEYFSMNETMRREFYTGSWKLEACEEHSIFLGQGDYPLKGMHFVLEAMAELKQKYPDITLYVAGSSIIERSTFKERLKLPASGKYLLSLIKKYGLEKKVIMTGKLTADEMKQQFLKSSVFVCASVLENSPNTIGEAMLLGVPVVASRAGGIPDMITGGQDGLLFAAGDASALAEAIERLWDRECDENGLCLAQQISEKAAKNARAAHDGMKNYQRLMEIYDKIEEKA